MDVVAESRNWIQLVEKSSYDGLQLCCHVMTPTEMSASEILGNTSL